jgi:hypothetical protein
LKADVGPGGPRILRKDRDHVRHIWQQVVRLGIGLGDKVLALAVLVAVGVGYLSLSKISVREAADGIAALRRGLSRRLQDAVGPTGDHTEERPTGARIGRRRIRPEEPMAGYGR